MKQIEWECAVRLGELQAAGWGGGDGRVREGGDVGVPVADSC